MDQQIEGLPEYIHINRNDFSYRKHIKQQEEDIAICECKYDANDPDSACGEACLNVLTSTECTPGYCRCGLFCKNQRFQKCEYAKTKLFRTEGRGWGLLADENIKAGRFVIEYCGEVISWKEARGRSQVYASLANLIVKQGSGRFWGKLELAYLQSKTYLLEQNLHMIIILNGMVGLRFAAFVGRSAALVFLGQSLVDSRRILIFGRMAMTGNVMHTLFSYAA